MRDVCYFFFLKSNFKDAFCETKSVICDSAARADKSELWFLCIQCHRDALWSSYLLLTMIHTHVHRHSSAPPRPRSRTIVLNELFIVIYCLFMYFKVDNISGVCA